MLRNKARSSLSSFVDHLIQILHPFR